jgi:GNAT superfamily N-acetyltransferase
MSIMIRRATSADVEALAALRVAFLAEEESLHDEAECATFLQLTRQYFAQAIPSGEFVSWVAEAEGEIVAISGLIFFQRPPSLQNPSGKEAFILNMYTVPQCRSRGLATQLLHALLHYVQTQTDAHRIWLYATPPGKPIYEKAGFKTKQRKMLEMDLTW